MAPLLALTLVLLFMAAAFGWVIFSKLATRRALRMERGESPSLGLPTERPPGSPPRSLLVVGVAPSEVVARLHAVTQPNLTGTRNPRLVPLAPGCMFYGHHKADGVTIWAARGWKVGSSLGYVRLRVTPDPRGALIRVTYWCPSAIVAMTLSLAGVLWPGGPNSRWPLTSVQSVAFLLMFLIIAKDTLWGLRRRQIVANELLRRPPT